MVSSTGSEVWVASLLVVAVLAGCLAGPSDAGGAETSDTTPEDDGWLCDRDRPATAHRPGGVPVDDPPEPVPVPCLSKTGFHSREPTIGISADGTIFHYPAMTGDNFQPTGVAISRDGGESWSISVPNVSGQPTHPASFDPYFYLDQRTGRIFADDLVVPPNCSVLSWSDDQAGSWDRSLSGCTEADHQTIFAGPPATSSPMGYPNVVYRCAINAVALAGASTMTTCQRSPDGGRTWIQTGEPAFVTPTDRLPGFCHGASGHGFVDGDGVVYLPKGLCGEPWLAISDDEGASWERVRVSDHRMSGHDAGVGADPDGNLYYLYVAEEDRLPYLTVSTDGGATWTDPVMVGAPGVNEASQPEMIVGGSGRLAFVYMGTTNGPGPPFEGGYGNVTWNAYAGMTVDALADEPVVYSAPVNDPETDPFVTGRCGSTRCQGVQDFMDVRIGPDGRPFGAFVDDCLGPRDRCLRYDEAIDTHRMGAVGWLRDGPTLWGEDPNGRYPDDATG